MSKKYRPVEPINRKMFESLGLSIDPKDIPKEKQNKSIILKKIEEKEIIKEAAIRAAEDAFENSRGRG